MAESLDYDNPDEATLAPRQSNSMKPVPPWWDQAQVDKWYTDELGRPATNPDEFYQGNPTGGHYGMEHQGLGSMADVYGMVHGSEEAKAYRGRQMAPPAAAAATPQSDYSGGGGSGQLDSMIQSLMGQFQTQMGWAGEDRAARQEWANFLKTSIQKQMADSQKPVDPHDPLMARQLQAADANNQRTLNQSRESMAARAAAGGGPTQGAQDAAVQSGTENLGVQLNGMMLKLWADEVDKRREQLTASISQGAGILNTEEATAAAQQAAQLEALSSSLRAKLANQQHYDDMSYTASHDNAVLNYLYTQLAGAGGQ